MRTPYVKHTFGPEVERKLRSRRGWLTMGVASSVGWPKSDVCVEYAGDEFFLRGLERDGAPSPPGITIACNADDPSEPMAKIFRFNAVLGWFLGGYVDPSGAIHGSHPVLVGNPRTIYSEAGIAGLKSFSCNYMPIIEHESTRIALAFWREGLRLERVHQSYSFLSFYKVIESQFRSAREKIDWMETGLSRLSGRSAARVSFLRSQNRDVGRHLYESGRCAVAHASVDREIIDPDIPADRRRISEDLVVMQELAKIYIRDELMVPTAASLYQTRKRTSPWLPLFDEQARASMEAGSAPSDLSCFEGLRISIALWPDGVIDGLSDMKCFPQPVNETCVKLVLLNPSGTILLVFYVDCASTKVHAALDEGGMIEAPELKEIDVRAYATFFYYVLGNRIAELHVAGLEPVDCEAVIPVNIIPPNPSDAIEAQVVRFKEERSKSGRDFQTPISSL